MPPDVSWLLCLLLTVLPSSAVPDVIRPSCRAHFLAGHRKTGVYSLGNDVGSRMVCEMPSSYEDPSSSVTTVIGSALETPTAVTRRSSSNFQAVDLFWLKELVRTAADCQQTVTVEWPAAPVDSVPSGIILVSLLNVSTHIAARDGTQTFELSGHSAGIRHLLPDAEGSPRPPTVTATSLRCRQKVVEKRECLSTGGLEVEASASPWKYEFSFRTDRSDQALLSLMNGEKETTHVRLEDDFFLRVDGGASIAVGQLSDAEWHTVALTVSGETVRLQIDEVPVDVTSSALKSSRLTMLHIKVDGEVLLLEPCNANRVAGSINELMPVSANLCSGCDCNILPQHFDGLASVTCDEDEDEDSAFQLLRDPDRLSFLQIPDAFSVDADDGLDIRVAMSFKSDSDAGLLLFGYWHGMPGKGRWQVHYAGSNASALLCRTFDGEEACLACGIDSGRNLGLDEWHRVVFFGSGDAYTFSIDRKACHLEMITAKNNVSTSEVYAIPAVTQGVGLFVGGTYYEKKKGLYRQDFTQRFFENTREKMTSLRGCVKDVFVHGKEIDLGKVYRTQMESILLDPEDMNSFAIQIGCAECTPFCSDGIRCRLPAPVRGSMAKCDCADAHLVEATDGTCSARNNSPVPLSTSFISQNPVVLPLETTKAVLSRLWLKLRLPKKPKDEIVVADFNSHRETMFRVVVSPEGTLSVQAHPHDGSGFATTASHSVTFGDDRVHQISIARRTPVGTRHTARKYELMMDGERFELPDTGKSLLNNVTFVVAERANEEDSVIVHDIGVGYDLDEHVFLWHPSNTIHQVDLHSRLVSHMYRTPDPRRTGTLEPYLWEGEISPKGEIVEYSPDVYEPELLLSSRWLFYSIILLMLLLLLLLACACCYCCLARGRTRSNASDREQMMRDSPDYAPVKLRRGSSNFSFHDDNSIGTDDTDLNAYRDIPSHRVKIYRESMVSILVPSMDEPAEAAIVKRLSVEEPRSPPPGSPAPLVSVTEEEQ